MCQKVNTQEIGFPSFIEGKTKTRRRAGASFADQRRNLQRTLGRLLKELIAHELPAVEVAPELKNRKKNRRPLWQGKLEKLSGAALRRCAVDEFEMDELTLSESHVDLREFVDDDVVIDSDLDLHERFGLDDDERFDDEDCGYMEDYDYGYMEDHDYGYLENHDYDYFENEHRFEAFFDALDRAPSRSNGISLWDLPEESRFYMLGYTSDPSLDDWNWDELLAELLSGAESEECEAAYQRPRISNFIELPGGRLKRLKGSRNGPSRKCTLGRRCDQRVTDALYRAYEEELHSIEEEIREQERLAAFEAFRLRLEAEDQSRRSNGSVLSKTAPVKSLSSRHGFQSAEELTAHVRATLLKKKRG